MEYIKTKKFNSFYAYINFWFFILSILTCETLDLLNDHNESLLIKNNLVAILPLLESKYSVLLKLKPIRIPAGFKNIIHFTTGNNFGAFGERAPAIFNDGSGKLYIYSTVNKSNGAYELFRSKPLPLHKWTSIRMSQFQNNGVYTFVVFIDEINVYSTRNQSPQSFQNVKVYASNPWHDVINCFIKDFRVINGNQVIKISSPWVYKQPTGTLLQTETFLFVCNQVQLRQQTLCYQREISSGIVTFLPIQVMDVIGYDPNTTIIYGRTLRNNFVEVDVKKEQSRVISIEKCSRIKACDPSLGAN
ncbi:uncharacterized protein LOC136089265 [Hydra vulgaris]|uniref:Uncharacterized protein LOC136089265 n=1 Tax=Hydra vulgaris TaxID=6087 RepID=A0ABM4DA08_HYDVU